MGGMRWHLRNLGLGKEERASIMARGLSAKQSIKVAKDYLVTKVKAALLIHRKILPGNKSITHREKETKKGGKK